jgi:TFIIF-interacting CTD phosphatase-like protein
VANRRLQDAVLVDNSPYCHLLQPENAVPIVPFYHYARDNELETLLDFLR